MANVIASAVFDSHAEADRAIEDLRRAGVSDRALSVIGQHGGQPGAGTTQIADDGDSGSVTRGILGGGALGAGLGVAALAIPGVGPLVAAGAIAATAVPTALGIGAVAGAAAGTLNEALGAHGVDEADTGYYSDRIGQGGVFVSVDSSVNDVDVATINDILYRNGGHNSTRARSAAATTSY